jgi:hypothetical protein
VSFVDNGNKSAGFSTGFLALFLIVNTEYRITPLIEIKKMIKNFRLIINSLSVKKPISDMDMPKNCSIDIGSWNNMNPPVKMQTIFKWPITLYL